MRTIAISAILALVPGLALAQNNGLTATGSSAGIGAEVAAVDTDFLGGNATMFGGNAHVQMGSFLRLEGRYLTGVMSSKYSGIDVDERAHLIEGEATVGFAASDQTRLFVGGGYRALKSQPIPDGDRLSNTLYLPFGVASHGRISSEWTAITTLAGGFVIYGLEDIQDPNMGLDETFSRDSGWMARASIEFGRSYHLGTLSVEPFFRFYQLDQTDPQSGVRVDKLDVTEGGIRFNYHL